MKVRRIFQFSKYRLVKLLSQKRPHFVRKECQWFFPRLAWWRGVSRSVKTNRTTDPLAGEQIKKSVGAESFWPEKNASSCFVKAINLDPSWKHL